MSWIVDWNGAEYDVDPGEFTGLELSEIKKRSGFTYTGLMTEGLPMLDADAIRAVFWVVEKRSNPDLKFSDYEGPPMRVIVQNFAGLMALTEELGKVMAAAVAEEPPETSEEIGSLS